MITQMSMISTIISAMAVMLTTVRRVTIRPITMVAATNISDRN